MHAAVARRRHRPLCILDIALPRDVDPAVAKLDNVFLYDLDDLRNVVSSNAARRQAQLPAAEAVIGEEVERYWQWVAGLAAVPVLTEFRHEMNRVRERELAQALRRIPDLTPPQRAAVEHLSESCDSQRAFIRLRPPGNGGLASSTPLATCRLERSGGAHEHEMATRAPRQERPRMKRR